MTDIDVELTLGRTVNLGVTTPTVSLGVDTPSIELGVDTPSITLDVNVVVGGGSGGGASALDDLTDVTLTTPGNRFALVYDSATSKWIDNASPVLVEYDASPFVTLATGYEWSDTINGYGWGDDALLSIYELSATGLTANARYLAVWQIGFGNVEIPAGTAGTGKLERLAADSGESVFAKADPLAYALSLRFAPTISVHRNATEDRVFTPPTAYVVTEFRPTSTDWYFLAGLATSASGNSGLSGAAWYASRPEHAFQLFLIPEDPP